VTAEEKQRAKLHGVDAERVCCRRRKIAELRSEDLLKREYPLAPEEAFMASNFDTSDLVM
jgi:hypothetical protein